MPELPEVETIVVKLNQVLKGFVIKKITVLREKSFRGKPDEVFGQPITEVSRRAKLIRFHLGDGLNLLAHLKMTGQFIYVSKDKRVGGGHPTQDWVNTLPSSHTRVVFDLTKGKQKSKLFFNDQRVFGYIKVLDDAQVLKEYGALAPDINTEAASLKYFQEKLKRSKRSIKLVIMDTAVISGVGNIYACDGLNLARISPLRPANSLDRQESDRLLNALKQVILRGIAAGGATIDKYRDAEGLAGRYQDEVLVYGREGQKCKNCGGTIKKIKLGGRGTYYCPDCQW